MKQPRRLAKTVMSALALKKAVLNARNVMREKLGQAALTVWKESTDQRVILKLKSAINARQDFIKIKSSRHCVFLVFLVPLITNLVKVDANFVTRSFTPTLPRKNHARDVPLGNHRFEEVLVAFHVLLEKLVQAATYA
jgi:hypothetical protein